MCNIVFSGRSYNDLDKAHAAVERKAIKEGWNSQKIGGQKASLSRAWNAAQKVEETVASITLDTTPTKVTDQITLPSGETITLTNSNGSKVRCEDITTIRCGNTIIWRV